MTFKLNEETCVIYDGFSQMVAGIVTEIGSLAEGGRITSIVVEDENVNGSTTATRVYVDQIDDVLQ